MAIGDDVIGIDMTELLDLDAERSALLAYLFRSIERLIEDRRPTMIVIDEAWKMLADEMFVKRLHDWLLLVVQGCDVRAHSRQRCDLRQLPVWSGGIHDV